MPGTFEWIDEWARIPDTPSGRANGRTHGVTVAGDGRIIVFHQAANGLLTFDPFGFLIFTGFGIYAGLTFPGWLLRNIRFRRGLPERDRTERAGGKANPQTEMVQCRRTDLPVSTFRHARRRGWRTSSRRLCLNRAGCDSGDHREGNS